MNVKVEFATQIVKAYCILHNFVRVRDGYNFEDTLTVVGLSDVENARIGRGKTGARCQKRLLTILREQKRVCALAE